MRIEAKGRAGVSTVTVGIAVFRDVPADDAFVRRVRTVGLGPSVRQHWFSVSTEGTDDAVLGVTVHSVETDDRDLLDGLHAIGGRSAGRGDAVLVGPEARRVSPIAVRRIHVGQVRRTFGTPVDDVVRSLPDVRSGSPAPERRQSVDRMRHATA